VIGLSATKGLEFGLLLSALGFGFRHGIDWDHIAAITDVTSSQSNRRTAIWLGTLYALGHASVVFALGIAAILFGERLPSGVDDVMTRVVGVTLLILGVYVFVSLIRHGRDFRMRSGWLLIFASARAGARKIRQLRRDGGGHPDGEPVDLSHRPISGGAVDVRDSDEVGASSWHHGHHGRPGHHHHRSPEQEDQFANYGTGTAFAVGMIHGVGAETPTQVLIFLAAAGTGGLTAGVAVLAAFIVGLLASNSLITATSAFGYMTVSKNFAIYATVAVLTGVFSLVIGTIFVLGKTTLLPALFGG